MTTKQYEDALSKLESGKLKELQGDLYCMLDGETEKNIKSALQDKINGGWLPIETAPKDGTTVITYPHYKVTHYGTGESRSFWVEDYNEDTGDWDFMTKEPTHWQPLPQPPKENNDD